MTTLNEWWEKGLEYHAFVDSSSEHKGLWEGIHRLAKVPADAGAGIAPDAGYRFLVIAEDWCGDASNTIPIVAKWVEQTPGLALRVILRDTHPELMDRYLTNGARSIPIVIVLDRDGRELGHWGPRPAALQQWVMENKGKMPKEQLYPEVRKWYARDHGETTIRELRALLT